MSATPSLIKRVQGHDITFIIGHALLKKAILLHKRATVPLYLSICVDTYVQGFQFLQTWDQGYLRIKINFEHNALNRGRYPYEMTRKIGTFYNKYYVLIITYYLLLRIIYYYVLVLFQVPCQGKELCFRLLEEYKCY